MQTRTIRSLAYRWCRRWYTLVLSRPVKDAYNSYGHNIRAVHRARVDKVLKHFVNWIQARTNDTWGRVVALTSVGYRTSEATVYLSNLFVCTKLMEPSKTLMPTHMVHARGSRSNIREIGRLSVARSTKHSVDRT